MTTTTEIVLVGNLTADPELRTTPSGIFVCNARLAFTPYYPETKKQGETVFYNLTIWRQLGEHAAMTLHKGDRVIVAGTGSIREWTGNDGEIHKDKEINVTAIGPDLRYATATIVKMDKERDRAGGVEEAQEEMF
jgi:single-strand DNA-binding protein